MNIIEYVLIGHLILIAIADIACGGKFSKVGPPFCAFVGIAMYIIGRLNGAS